MIDWLVDTIAPGQMEQTFMYETCSAANLRSLFQDINLPEDIRNQILPELQKAFDSDNRGTLLNDGLALGSGGATIRLYSSSSATQFPAGITSLVLGHFGELCKLKGMFE